MSNLIKCSCCSNGINPALEKFFVIGARRDTTVCLRCASAMGSHANNVMGVKPEQVTQRETNKVRAAEQTEPGLNVKMSPREFYEKIGKVVIGAEAGRKAIANSIAQHARRIQDPSLKSIKENTLIFGPTGTGKTLMASEAAKILDVPFVEFGCAGLTPAAYIGQSFEACISLLLSAAGGDVKKAEKGVIFLDEFDKLSMRYTQGDFNKSQAVQQEMIKILEGADVEIKPDARAAASGGGSIVINTSNILFIATGAFVGLENTINKTEKSLGIAGNVTPPKAIENWQEKIDSQHLIEFGFMEELIGRFSSIGYTKQHTKEELIRIICDSEGSVLKGYQELFKKDNVYLGIDKGYIEALAEQSLKDPVGVRALKKNLSKRLSDIYFDIDKYKYGAVTVYADRIETKREQDLYIGAKAS